MFNHIMNADKNGETTIIFTAMYNNNDVRPTITWSSVVSVTISAFLLISLSSLVIYL